MKRKPRLQKRRAKGKPATTPTTPSDAPIVFTRMTKANGPMTKRIGLDADGNVVKDSSACAMSIGEAERIEVPDLQAFAGVLSKLSTAQAIVCGVAVNGRAKNPVLSRARANNTKREHITRTRDMFTWPKSRTLFALDHDPHPRSPMVLDTPAVFIAQLKRVDPQWEHVEYVRTYSTSSSLYRGKTEVVAPRGYHLYSAGPLDKPGYTPETYSKALFMRCWEEGLGYIAISRAGSMLRRTIFDAAVHQPERLLFEAGAEIDPQSGLTQRLPAPEYYPGRPLDFAVLKPTVRLKNAVEKLVAQARLEAQPEAAQVRAVYIEAESQKLAGKTGIKLEVARALVTERANGHLYAADLVHLDEHGWVSVHDLLTDEKYLGATCADPAEPEYHAGPDGIGRNVAVVHKGTIRSQAHGGIRYQLHDEAVLRPRLQVGETIEQLFPRFDALIKAAGGIYQRGESLVEPILASQIPGESVVRRDPNARVLYELSTPRLILAATERIVFEKLDRDGMPHAVDCPEHLAITYRASSGRWSLPRIDGIAHAPFMRTDGSIHLTEGYDAASGMILVLNGLALPEVPAKPTQEEVKRAKAILLEPLAEFPFADEASRAVAVAIALTILQRPVLPAVPANLVDANAAGSGKSLLTDTLAIAVTGVQPASMALTEDNLESEKRLASALMEGDVVIKLDNLSVPIGGDLMNMVLTEPVAKLRVLGSHNRRHIENRQIIIATGNVLEVLDDMRRRAVMCSLDAKMEKPELRSGFKIAHLRAWARANRGDFVWALLTLQRAHLAAGRPRGAAPLGSFESWSESVRDVLLYHGYADPVATQARIEGRDTTLRERATIFEAIHGYFKQRAVRAREIADCIARGYGVLEVPGVTDPALTKLHAAFSEQFGAGGSNAKVVGAWLHRNLHRIAGGYRLERDEDSHEKLARWRVMPLNVEK